MISQCAATGTRISNRLRQQYLRSALRQEVRFCRCTCSSSLSCCWSLPFCSGTIFGVSLTLWTFAHIGCFALQVAFYDTEATTGVLLQGLNEDTNGVQNATGEKVRWVWHRMHFTDFHPAHHQGLAPCVYVSF